MESGSTGKLRYPKHYPKKPQYGTQPQSDWQRQVKAELDPLLSSRGWRRRFATLLYYDDSQVQVYLDNWTLHFQVSIKGDEFEKTDDYGDLQGKALIAFDVENGNRGIKPSDLRALQTEVTAALRDAGVYEKLGVREEACREHHLVMEADAYDVEYAARRLVEYMDAIYDIAEPVLNRLQSG